MAAILIHAATATQCSSVSSHVVELDQRLVCKPQIKMSSSSASARSRMDQALLFGQFDILDVCRRAQGDLYASLGFGPVESSHHVIASAPFWRLRDYGASSGSASVLIVAAPIKRPYIWDLAPPVSAIRRCLDADLRVLLLEWLPASEATCNVGITECVQASTPTLAVVNTADPVAPVNSVRPIGETLGPEEFQLIEYPGERGICLQHLGVLVGRQAHAWLWPQIVDWIRTRTRWARHPDGVAAE